MRTIPQSCPIAAQRGLYFTAVDVTNLQTRQTGLTAFTKRLVKPDGSEAAAGGSDPSETSAANDPGVYRYVPTTAEIATVGGYVLRISKSGMEPREIPFQVTPAVFGTVQAGSLSSASFTTDLTTATANHWKRCLIRFLTGALAGQVSKIAGYTVAGGAIAVVSGMEFTGAPSASDVFEILNG